MNDVGFEPVFIMGHHRSGTTILYKVLAQTGLFNVTTAFHVLKRTTLRDICSSGREAAARADVERLFERLGLRDREFDSMPINADLPEEYAWALQHQGRRPRLDAANVPSFLAFCRDVTVCQDPARPLLLKNPFDVANFLFMARTFPAARFVHIHRNPVDVINSQIRAVRSLLAQKNEYVALVVHRYRTLYERPAALAAVRFLYSPRWPVLVTQVARNVARSNDYILRHGKALGDRAFHVTYDELCSQPAGTIARILSFLGTGPAPAPDYATLISPREPVLLHEVAARRTRIRARNADYCRSFGV